MRCTFSLFHKTQKAFKFMSQITFYHMRFHQKRIYWKSLNPCENLLQIESSAYHLRQKYPKALKTPAPVHKSGARHED